MKTGVELTVAEHFVIHSLARRCIYNSKLEIHSTFLLLKG